MNYHLQYQFAYKAWVFPLSEQIQKKSKSILSDRSRFFGTVWVGGTLSYSRGKIYHIPDFSHFYYSAHIYDFICIGHVVFRVIRHDTIQPFCADVP